MKTRILVLLAALLCAGAGPAFAQGATATPPLADELAIQSLLRGEPVHGRITMIDGSHLFPMEQPDTTAAAVEAALRNLETASRLRV